MAGVFKFKRFEVSHDGPAMKVGTDGVLLGAWCKVGCGTRYALDIGTGSGLIALMLAQRGEGWGMEVDAVELHAGAARQAEANAAASPWSDRIDIYHTAVQDFAGRGSGYGLIASNPPYYDRSLCPPDPSRMAARHTAFLPHEELCAAVGRLLAPEGIFAVVLPQEIAGAFIRIAKDRGLHVRRRTDVRTTPDAAPKRSLMEFGKERPKEAVADELIIQTGPEQFTEEYQALTRDFYIKF